MLVQEDVMNRHENSSILILDNNEPSNAASMVNEGRIGASPDSM